MFYKVVDLLCFPLVIIII